MAPIFFCLFTDRFPVHTQNHSFVRYVLLNSRTRFITELSQNFHCIIEFFIKFILHVQIQQIKLFGNLLNIHKLNRKKNYILIDRLIDIESKKEDIRNSYG